MRDVKGKRSINPPLYRHYAMVGLRPIQRIIHCEQNELEMQHHTVLLTKRGKNENVPFFSHNSVTKHDVENTITFLESACIFASSYEFMLYHVMFFRFRTTTSNIGLKQHFLFITHECNGVNASNLQHNCTIDHAL